MKSALLLAGLSAFLLAGPIRAEDSFLGVSFGARALALGGAYSAVADDAQAPLWNPAGLAQLQEITLSGSQNHLSFTQNVFAVCLNVPAGRAGTFALSIQELNTDDLAQTTPVLDAGGNPVLDPTTGEPLLEITGFGKETDGTFLLAYGVGIAPGMLVGATGKALVGKAGKIMGSGLGCGLGAIVRLRKDVRLGLVAEDLGYTTVDWDDGTKTVMEPAGRLAACWQPLGKWLLAAELASPFGRADVTPSFGGEWRFSEVLAFRVGAEDFKLAGGVGFKMPLAEGKFVSADYAFVTGSRFEDRNRLTITVGL